MFANPYDTHADDAGSYWIEANEAGEWLLFCDAEEDPIAQFDTHNQALLEMGHRAGRVNYDV